MSRPELPTSLAARRALARPWPGVDAVRAGLAELVAAWVPCRDRRGVFALAYLEQTEAIHAALPQMAQRAWLAGLVVAFAEVYREALRDWSQGRRHAVVAPWRLALDAAAAGRTLVLQDLLLGMNAHIVHDLPVVLQARFGDADRRGCLADFRRLLAVIEGCVERVQDRVAAAYAPGLAVLDARLGRVDERVTLAGIAAQRALGYRLAAAAHGTLGRAALRRTVTAWSVAQARGILAPSRVPGALRLGARVEGR